MTDQDAYYTIQKEAVAEHKERGSRFLAYAYPVEQAGDIKEKLKALKKEHPKAAHYCFAYRLGVDGNNFRASDDGEPPGTAGKPILGQLDSRKLVNVLVVVVRYFGGTLLGVPGLIAAYKTAASLALQLTPAIQKPVLISYRLAFDYTLLNEVMMVLKGYNCIIQKQEAGLFCTLQTGIPKTHLQSVKVKLADIRNIDIALV